MEKFVLEKKGLFIERFDKSETFQYTKKIEDAQRFATADIPRTLRENISFLKDWGVLKVVISETSPPPAVIENIMPCPGCSGCRECSQSL